MDVFLTLVGPIGPFVEFDEYQDYYEKTIRELELPAILEAIREAHIRYPRWLDDVEVAAYTYARFHPEHEQVIDEALQQAGFDTEEGDENV